MKNNESISKISADEFLQFLSSPWDVNQPINRLIVAALNQQINNQTEDTEVFCICLLMDPVSHYSIIYNRAEQLI